MRFFIYKFMTSQAFGIVLFCLAGLLVGTTGFFVLRGTQAFSQEEVQGFPLVSKSSLEEAREAEEKGRLPEAVSAYERFIALKPDVPVGYFRLGALYFKMGLSTKAEEIYLKAVALKQDVAEAYFRLGYVAESQSDLPKALGYYEKAERNLCGNSSLFFNLGNVHAQLDHKDEAISYYKKAVAKNPAYLDAFVNLSVVSFHNGAYADADFYLRKAMALGYQAPREYLDTLAQKVR